MTAAQPRRRPSVAVIVAATVAIAVVAVFAVTAINASRSRGDDPSGSFCITFDHPSAEVSQVRRALDGQPRRGDPSLETQRGGAVFWWSETTAAGAPRELEADAQRVARGVRKALRTKRARPLETPAFRASLRRLEHEAPRACAGRAS